MSLSRKFEWICSTDEKNLERLETLQKQLTDYYGNKSTRAVYSSLIKVEESEAPTDDITKSFLKWFKQHQFGKVLEVGCGEGRIWKYLNNEYESIDYTGIEVDENTIAGNEKKWPNQNWFFNDVYNLDFKPESFDLCFSFYVLEHLVYPKKALEKMLKMVKPNGYLLLVFPDFTQTGRLPSQHLGFGHERSAFSKLKKGKIVDAVISFYDSRIRLKPALNKLAKMPGQFLINANPLCLHYQDGMIWPDIDAVYLANKNEVEGWAKEKDLLVDFPFGTFAPFDEHTFIVIQKKG